jgi:ATP phosphoribosyltransferase regulatory subunit
MRGEVTTQIARMLASKAKSEEKLFYITNCIRFLETKPLSEREFWQAGAELIGGDEVESDAEIIALLLNSLKSLGIKEASIDLGNIELFRRVARILKIGDLKALKKAVVSKSFSDLQKVMPNQRALKVFEYMMTKRGGPEIIRDLSKMLGSGIDEFKDYFEELFRLLKSHGCVDRVRVDLSTLREEMKYYNGTVFEVFLGGVGVPIGGGGRYDAMMKEFGLENTRATGFAVSVDLCVKALEASKFKLHFKESKISTRILYREGFCDKAIRLASRIRRKGMICSVEKYNNQNDGIVVGQEIIDLKTGGRFAF